MNLSDLTKFFIDLITAMTPFALGYLAYRQFVSGQHTHDLEAKLTTAAKTLDDETQARVQADALIVMLQNQQQINVAAIRGLEEKLNSEQENRLLAQNENTRLNLAVDSITRQFKTVSDQLAKLQAEYAEFKTQAALDQQKDSALIESLRSELLLARADTQRWQELATEYQSVNKGLQNDVIELQRQMGELAKKVDTDRLKPPVPAVPDHPIDEKKESNP